MSTSKVRVCHDLTNADSGSSVNEDTDTSDIPECKLGHVLRFVLWRTLFLYNKFVKGRAAPTRILLAKVDTKGAFRHVSVNVNQSPTFGCVFGGVAIVDRLLLQFGWTSSPSFWGVCAAAVEHSHNRTTFRNAVVTAEGRAATSHAERVPPREEEVRATLPSIYAFPTGFGGGLQDPFFVSTFVDDALFAEVEMRCLGGRRCLRATRSFVLDSFRWFGNRNAGEPPLFAPEKKTSWDTRMLMLGWLIDTMAMTISVPQEEKFVQLQDMLDQWPASRRTATVNEARSLLGKLLHLSEVVRPGEFFIHSPYPQPTGVSALAGRGSR